MARECLCPPKRLVREGGQGAPILDPGGFAPADPLTRSLASRFVGLLRSRGLARVRSLAMNWGVRSSRRGHNCEQFEHLVNRLNAVLRMYVERMRKHAS